MDFDYGDCNGPHTWALRFPAAAGKRQSPINLNTKSMVFDRTLKPLIVNFDAVVKETAEVKAHNFHVKVEGKGVLRGGPLETDYHLAQFHFHWGSGNTWGSEHHVNGVSSPSELHMVFANSKYGPNDVLTERPDGLSVLGIFLQLGNQTNPALEHLCNTLVGLKKGDQKVLEPRLSLHDLVPKDTSKYYTYSGSLTTPPCSECVTWIVLDEPIIITQNQLDTFRGLHSNCQLCSSTDNFRPICPLGDRKVRTTVCT
ncbi:Eukaryotic-type carbonic anhydrase [Fasciolopsis buskii]|uniref:carbonic anhydrase n=1 Tax=Fasciolopsis buskii TaxID=27845 RepID=A0A8E0VG63_9TREM|nr:Eukaryotic-type carbonic anhydrase [Fasciolopsis buski]